MPSAAHIPTLLNLLSVPSIPTAVTDSTTGTTANLTWAAPITDGGSPIISYTASRNGSDSNGFGVYTNTVGPTQLSQVFNNMTPGNLYYLSVFATNAIGNSATVTVPVTIASTVPGVPTTVTTTTSGTSATLTWAAPASDGGSAVTGYTASRDGTDSGGFGAYSNSVGPTTLSQVFNNLSAGTTYHLSVYATNANGNSTVVTVAVTTAAAATTVPNVPTSVSSSLNTSTSTATLTWAAPTSNGGSAITGYTVTRDGTDSTGAGAYSTTVSASTLTASFGNLSTGTTYHLTVAAVNSVGTGSAVSSTVVVPAATSTTGTEVPVGISGTYTRIFTDEFNGTTIDTTKWGKTWFGGTNMNGYTKYANYISLPGDGTVHLTTDSSGGGAILTSNPYNGDVTTGFQFGAGTVAEARIYFAGDGGSTIYGWPAWWADPQTWPSGGEIDIFEGLGSATTNYHHGTSSNPISSNSGTIPGSWSNAFHTYAVYEASGTNNIYWDGNLVRQYSTDDNGASKYLILTTGGPADSHYGSTYDMKVDYVRVWTKNS